MEGYRFFYLMVVVIALIGVGLFAIPVKAGDFAFVTSDATGNASPPAERQSQSSFTFATFSRLKQELAQTKSTK
jgi:hypothetical protein